MPVARETVDLLISDLSASFALTGAEARRVNGELRTRTGGTRISLAFTFSIGLFLVIYGLLEPLLWREGAVHWTFVVWGGAYLLLAAVLRWGGGSVKPGVETLVRFSEDGLRRERPRAFVAPWKAVLRAFDDGEFITVSMRATLMQPIGRTLVIPKRVLPDGGALLWQLLRNSLIGTRMLVQSPYASSPGLSMKSIENTRS